VLVHCTLLSATTARGSVARSRLCGATPHVPGQSSLPIIDDRELCPAREV